MIHVPADELWKFAIEQMLFPCVEFFLPTLFAEVDTEQGFSFLEQELHALDPESRSRTRRTDKLVSVALKSGEECWILIHIEVQGYQDENFPRRMYEYFYRAEDKYKRRITALAIFTDDAPNYFPNQYDAAFFGTRIVYRYNAYKVL
jgi:predicted transposase YdaD